MDEIQESVNQQKISINNLQTTIDCLEDQLSTVIQSFEESCETRPIRHDNQYVEKDFKLVPLSSR